MSDIEKKNAGTNTDLFKQFIDLNLEQKKKPHNIQIKNNAKQPVVHPSAKHSAKQSYRRYKSKIEPKLHSKIMINEDDDIINKIKEAFGLQAEKPNKNILEVQTGSMGSLIDNISQQPILTPASTTSFGGIFDIGKLTPAKIDSMSGDNILKTLHAYEKAITMEDREIVRETVMDKVKEAEAAGKELDEDEQIKLMKEALKKMVARKQTEARTNKLQEIADISPADQDELTGRVNLRAATSLLLSEKPDEDYHYDERTISDADAEAEDMEAFKINIVKARPSLSHITDTDATKLQNYFRQKQAKRELQKLKAAEEISLRNSLSDIQSQASTLQPDRSLFEILNMPRGRGRPKTAENKRKEYAAALLQQKKINKDKSPYERPQPFASNNPYDAKYSYSKKDIYKKNPEKLFEYNRENIYTR